jgi:hypothetical protein
MTAGHGSKRAQREEAAIVGLLCEPTVDAAARKAGISETTLLRWMAEPEFKTRLRAARRAVVEAAIGRLQRASTEAVDALTRNLTCGVPAVEVGAARTVLDQSIKAVELVDLVERVEALEVASERSAEREQGRRR